MFVSCCSQIKKCKGREFILDKTMEKDFHHLFPILMAAKNTGTSLDKQEGTKKEKEYFHT